MCAIAGIWETSDGTAVRQMMNVLIHRGPDGSGTYSSELTRVLGHPQNASSIQAPGRNLELKGNSAEIAEILKPHRQYVSHRNSWMVSLPHHDRENQVTGFDSPFQSRPAAAASIQRLFRQSQAAHRTVITNPYRHPHRP